MYCPQCGSRKEPDELACRICGYAAPSRPGDQRCPACGEPVGSEDRYCHACGARLPEHPAETTGAAPFTIEGDLEIDPRALPDWLREFAQEQETVSPAGAPQASAPAWLAATRGELSRGKDEEPASSSAERSAQAEDSDLLQLIDERDLPEWLRELDVDIPAATEARATPAEEDRASLPPPAVARAWFAPETIQTEHETVSAFEHLAPALAHVAPKPAAAVPEQPSRPGSTEEAAQAAPSNWLRRVLLLLVLVVIALLVVYVLVLSR